MTNMKTFRIFGYIIDIHITKKNQSRSYRGYPNNEPCQRCGKPSINGHHCESCASDYAFGY